MIPVPGMKVNEKFPLIRGIEGVWVCSPFYEGGWGDLGSREYRHPEALEGH